MTYIFEDRGGDEGERERERHLDIKLFITQCIARRGGEGKRGGKENHIL